MRRPKSTALGDNLRTMRRRAGLGQRDLSAASGVSLTIINSIESGVTKNPGVCAVLGLADALGVSLNSLVRKHDKARHKLRP